MADAQTVQPEHGTAAAAAAATGSSMQEERRDTLAMGGGRRAVIIIQDYTGAPPPPAPPPWTGSAADESEDDGPEGSDGHELEPDMLPGQPPLPSVATLCNSAIGAGMLSLPFAFSKAGVWGPSERLSGPLLPTLQHPGVSGMQSRGPCAGEGLGRLSALTTLWQGQGQRDECLPLASLWQGQGRGQARTPLCSAWQGQGSAGAASGQGHGKGRATSSSLRQAPAQGQGQAQSPWQSVATMCASAVGAGLLSLPAAFAQAGVLGGVLLCATIGAAEAFTLYVLSKMAERYRATSYSQLVRKTLGKKMATFLSLLMAAYMWGACNAYLVIVGDVFSALGYNAFGPHSLFANRRIIIMAIGLGVLLPLCFIKRLGALAALSSIAVVGFLYTSAVVIATAFKEAGAREDPWKDVQLIKFDMGAFFALPVIVFGFNCHANAVTIFHELTHEPAKQILPIKSRKKTSKLVNMIGVIIAAIMLIMVGYLSVGLAGYLAYPTSVTSNIINNLPANDPWVEIARAFIGVVVAGHYPLNHHPARSGAVDLALSAGYSQAVAEDFIAPMFTLIFVGTSVLVSLFVQDLGDVLHLIGGTAAAMLIFFNPGCMLINAAIMKDSSARLARVSTLQKAREDASLRGEELGHHDAKAARDEARVPLLEAAVVKGIKKTGLVYSPGKSWTAGLLLVAFSIVIMVTTIVTTFIR